MTKKKYNSEDGVWRTIGGRKVFIRKGQSLSDAMKESGKFKKTSDVKRGDYHKLKAELDYERQKEKANKLDKDMDLKYGNYREHWQDWTEQDHEKVRRAYQKVSEKRSDMWDRKYPKTLLEDTGDKTKLKGKHIEGKRTTSQVNNEYNELSKKMQQDDYYYKVEDDRKLKNLRAEYDTLVARGQEDVNLTAYNKNEDISPMSEWSDTNGSGFSDLQDKEIARRVKENKIVDSFGNNVVYQNDKGNWINSRDNYNNYVNGKTDRLGGELVLNEKQARDSLASYDALDKVPYENNDENTKKYLKQKQENLDKMYKSIGYDDSKYNYGFKEKKKETYEEYVQRVLNNDDYLQANRPNAYFNKMVKETPYIKTLEKHNLNNSDPEFKRSMLGRMESDIKYYTGNGGGYSGHLWAKDEKEQIDLMKALYNTLPEKEKPDWINESKIDEYSKQMEFIKNNKNIKERYSSMYDYLKNNTLMSESEIIKQLKELDKKRK